MKKILILYDHRGEKCITGGQFYEENMYKCMQEDSTIEVERISINRGRSFIDKLFSPILNLRYLSLCNEFDLVIFNSVEGWYFIPLVILIRLFTKTKVGIIHHHFLYLEFSGLKRFFYKNLESAFLKLSNYIITVSPYIKDLCASKFPKKNIRIWPIPFSDEIIEVNRDQKKEGFLIYIGTIEPRKGLIYLMGALERLNKLQISYNLNIVGKVKDSQYYEELKKYIEQHNLNVKFLGFLDDKEKDRILKESQIFVFPSLLEGYGMVLREVMSYGLPIICFNNSAMPYLVKNKINGIIVNNKNVDDFAQAIAEVITNKKLQGNLSDGAYETSKETTTPEKYKEIVSSELKILI